MAKPGFFEVTSDGTVNGTKIISPNGETVGGVKSIQINADCNRPLVEATVEMYTGYRAHFPEPQVTFIDPDARELVKELFHQECYVDGKYDHFCISTYEFAQKQLIAWGLINKEDCVRD